MKGLAPWLLISLTAMLTGSASQRPGHPAIFRHAAVASPAPAALPSAAAIQKPALLTMVGVASWYSSNDPGVQPVTASGETFDDRQLTCAVWNLPFNAKLHVTNLETGQQVVVRVNDRGPARRLVAQGRVVDLSKGAFSQIANLGQGLVPVKVELVAD